MSVSSLRNVAIVGLEDSTKLFLTANGSVRFLLEALIEHLIVHSDAAVRTLPVVVINPCLDNVVKFVAVEADQEIDKQAHDLLASSLV